MTPLVLTEEQSQLARTAGELVGRSLAPLRTLRDTRDARGYSAERYARMVALGWTAIPFAEADGGLGMGFAELVVVTEAMGRGLAPEPIIPVIALAGRALALGGRHPGVVADVIAGKQIVALACSARGRFDPGRAPFRATPEGGGFRLVGEATQVWGGALADAYVVAADTGALFLVRADAARTTRQHRIDSHNACLVALDTVVGADAIVGDRAVLEAALDGATVALCGEMLGGMAEALERTIGYLRERHQFGVAIGSFQALKHRAARLYIELELSRSAVMAAARALDAGDPDAAQLVSLAKARLSDAYCLVTNEAVQLHGGIGMTDEHDIGLFLKRARACEQTFGDAAYHRDRFARLAGF
jgi:alkylation response protein AidB-like acyl-CoA dehydrogenase